MKATYRDSEQALIAEIRTVLDRHNVHLKVERQSLGDDDLAELQAFIIGKDIYH
jgi:hypothetical protein